MMENYLVQPIDGGTQDKKHRFFYYKPKQFEELRRENPNIRVIGNVRLSKKNHAASTDSTTVEIGSALYPILPSVDKACKGYISVGNDRYLRVERTVPVILLVSGLSALAAAAVAACICFSVFQAGPSEPSLLPVASGVEWDGSYPKSGETTSADTSSIEIPGYANLVISEDNPIVDFINPAGNTVYFRYTLEKDGATVYQTDLIQPNQFLAVDLYSLLEKGTYTVRFKIETFDVDTQVPCNGAIQETTVTVK